mmetsp:Transcript_148203/g.474363  ORF Transcript_148203/g.474363 Transcript_148203/m.474363 type:complete len:269 (+) Transcript_148203:1697-2503(+)
MPDLLLNRGRCTSAIAAAAATATAALVGATTAATTSAAVVVAAAAAAAVVVGAGTAAATATAVDGSSACWLPAGPAPSSHVLHLIFVVVVSILTLLRQLLLVQRLLHHVLVVVFGDGIAIFVELLREGIHEHVLLHAHRLKHPEQVREPHLAGALSVVGAEEVDDLGDHLVLGPLQDDLLRDIRHLLRAIILFLILLLLDHGRGRCLRGPRLARAGRPLGPGIRCSRSSMHAHPLPQRCLCGGKAAQESERGAQRGDEHEQRCRRRQR